MQSRHLLDQPVFLSQKILHPAGVALQLRLANLPGKLPEPFLQTGRPDLPHTIERRLLPRLAPPLGLRVPRPLFSATSADRQGRQKPPVLSRTLENPGHDDRPEGGEIGLQKPPDLPESGV